MRYLERCSLLRQESGRTTRFLGRESAVAQFWGPIFSCKSSGFESSKNRTGGLPRCKHASRVSLITLSLTFLFLFRHPSHFCTPFRPALLFPKTVSGRFLRVLALIL